MASLVHQASMPAMAPPCDEELVPQGFISCFGRSLSRASSSSRLEYRALQQEQQGEERRAAQEARSARAKLRWKAVAHEIMAKGGAGARRRKQQLAAFSYDSRSYALNFDQGADE